MGKAKRFAEAAGKRQETKPSLEEADALIYGAPRVNAPDAGRQVAKPISIFEIAPDPTQPRRAIPSLVRAGWDGSPATVAEQVFPAWLAAIEHERGTLDDFPLDGYLTGGDTPRAARVENGDEAADEGVGGVSSPAADALMRVIELAASIRRDGLTNPVTVGERPGGGYQLETGERRWLAYHLLHWRLGDDQYARIPARLVDHVSVWRQAAENNARDDLNPIAKARQYALLMMNLYQDQVDFGSLAAFEHERDFYAQVADAKAFRVPSGRGEALMNAMGVTTRQALAIYRGLLNTPREVWTLADDHNLTIDAIRRLSGGAMDSVDENVNSIDNSAPNASHARADRSGVLVDQAVSQTTRFWKHMRRSLTQAPPDEKAEIVRLLRELQHEIEQEIARVEQG